jgi:predicted transcriptional regulator
MHDRKAGSDGRVVCVPAAGTDKPKPVKLVEKTKTEILRKLLSGPTGATVTEIHKRLAWQPQTIRAAVSRLRSSGLTIDLDRTERVARYRAIDAENGQ